MTNWETVMTNLKKITKEAAYDGFLKNMNFVEKKDNIIYIGVYNDFIQKRIKEKHQELVLELIRDVPEWSNVEEIRFVVDERFDVEIDEIEEKDIPDLKISDDSPFNQKYRFENFVIGKSNEFAHATSIAVASKPGKQYNPLFLYGGVGLGKTHLMKAIGNRILEGQPEARVVYSSAEKFTNEMIGSLSIGLMNDFRKKYRSVDVLLIDDIQFLVGKERTQEEFFHTFNELFEREKQIVLSSDRPPSQLQKIEDRLISRFESGMIADIQAPDLELRVAILKKEADKKGIMIEDEALLYLGKKIISNIRKLEGAFIRICAYASMNSVKVTTLLVDNVLKDMLATNQKKITIEEIQRAVSDYYGIKLSDMKGKNRSQNVAFPRQVAMYLSRELTNESLPSVGKSFGGKDHTTVIHACKRVENMLNTDLEFKEELDSIIRRING